MNAGSVLRLLIACVACLWLASGPALAKEKPSQSAAAASALPEPLTREAIRELVSRLDDTEVRRLLIEQLDRAAAPKPAKPADDMTGMAQGASEAFAHLRERGAAVWASGADFPDVLEQVAVRMSEPRDPSVLWLIAAWFLVMLACSALAEWAFRFATRRAVERFEARPAEGLGGRTVQVLFRAALGVGHLAAFAAGGVALFLARWQGHEPTRFIVVVLFSAILGVRLLALVVRLLLEPKSAASRLLPFDDRAAAVIYWGVVRLAALYALLRVANVFLARFGAPLEPQVLLGMVGSAIFLALLLDTLWKVREDVARLIRGEGAAGALRRLLADLWPFLAAAYLVAIYVLRVYDVLRGGVEQGGSAAILSVVLLLVLPLADMWLCRVLAALMGRGDVGTTDPAAPRTDGFEPVLRRAIHIVVLVLGFVSLAALWDLNLFALAERSLGGRIASALFGIAITTLLAWVLWEVARTAIDRRIAEETFSAEHKAPVSRLRTLLPLLRATLLATIVVMAVLSILAALGINIVPLLAGASVVGVAIGFGSQTLVRDIVSGAFFLMDDAFRLGEYIEVGDAKGIVEKIGVRAVVLRHHRGPLNVLPYGEIKRLRNTSRDWMIMKMEFRLAFDTDLKKVKQIMKKIGQALAADPELGKDLIEPLKSQGVAATDDSALIVRAKFMARPAGGTAYTIRREAYARIIKAFAEEGIKFAERRVMVTVPPGTSAEAAAAAGAAAGRVATTP